VDPELQSLTAALTSLKIGTLSTCAALALALQHKGVMCIDDLRLLSEADARDLLERVGFEKIQQLKLMQAVASPLPAAAAPAAATADAARAAAGSCIPALSLRMTARGFTMAVPGLTHADVFALDELNATILRVRVRGVYQLHAAIHALSGCGTQATLEVFVNGTVRCRSCFSLEGYAGTHFSGPLIVFDILQLDANDAITVQPQLRYGDDFVNRLNLVLLQRL
jgi:hypothetical protein